MLGDMLSSEHAGILSSKTAVSPWQGIRNARVWALAMVYLCIGTSGIGAVFFLPLMIKSMGFSVRTTGLLAGLPGIAAALALPLWGIWRDRSGRGELVVGFACCAIALGLSGAAVLMPSPWALLPISVAMMGFYGSLAAFWTVPSTFLVGASAAVGIGFINVVGNLGNFTGPALLGAAADQGGPYSTGLWLLAAIAATAVAILVAGADSRTKRVVL
jgi:ACS family tartrate transporter-like MFS transporter